MIRLRPFVRSSVVSAAVFLLAWMPLLLAQSGATNQTLRLATVRIGELPHDEKLAAPIKQPRKRNAAQRKQYQRSSKWRLVTGYRGKEYVYGEIQFIGKQEINGFIYRENNELVYIYGTVSNHRFVAFDLQGNLYQLLLRANQFRN